MAIYSQLLRGQRVGMDKMVVGKAPGRQNQTGIEVSVAIFFDGTGNNRNNVAQRHMVQQNKQEEDGIRRNGSFEKYGLKKGQLKDNSYAAGYSNVSILERLNRKRITEQREISLYVEGIGTTDDKDDAMLGSGLGNWSTGIAGKVERGVMLLADRIALVLKPLKNAYVNQLTLDVFGFSRGSAAARHFISLVHEAKHPLAVRLGTPQAQVRIKFVGLFDTVSSYRGTGVLLEQSNVQELGLALGAVPQKVVHLTAGNEYRRNFSLTDITSSLGVGYELTLPGVHSNIGGSYGEHEDEERHLHLWERAALIAQGWYTKEEAPVHEAPVYDEYGNQIGTQQWAVGVRKGLGQDYQFIPLRIMADNAAKEAMSLQPLSGDYAKYAIAPTHPLAPVQAAILAQVGPHGSHGRHALVLAGEWSQVPPGADIKPLALTPGQAVLVRHCYLRRSASIGWQGLGDGRLGMGERRDDDNRPHRKIFPG
ncbi:phospholipase effector Tle1 domain-containing protein [Hymenobacter psoromatis]|uniref:phospholipase effector Tle1 domain-containing protein n=1 Tax=Hymenobacter psoromatis TaxID=1484116 RepID=UPI001CC1BF07|nr:DUF2235 domain-containing protein [Hymenobacter psoromatis]